MVDVLNGFVRRIPVWPFYVIVPVPGVWWFWLATQNRLGADPVNTLDRNMGLLALQLLIAALMVTPLRDLTRINLLRFRRMIGLMAFFYALAHLNVWLLLDRQLDWPRITADLVKRPYIILGMSAFLMLLPLALTSNDFSIRRMGPMAWRKLHWLAYPAAALAAIHFVWLVKAWPPQPMVYAGIVAALLGWRVARRKRRGRMRGPGARLSRAV